MTQYFRLLCLLVCLGFQNLVLAGRDGWEDSGLLGSNMGLRILKRENGKIGRFLKMDSHPTMNMVNKKKTILFMFNIYVLSGWYSTFFWLWWSSLQTWRWTQIWSSLFQTESLKAGILGILDTDKLLQKWTRIRNILKNVCIVSTHFIPIMGKNMTFQ